MEGKNKSWSKPDYEDWQELSGQLIRLPPNRFYFLGTMATFALVAWIVKDSWYGVPIVVAAMLVFATCVFFMHRKEDDGQETKNRSAESEDDARAAREIGEADGGNGCRKHDGHGSSSPSGLRTPLESQKEETADNHS